VIATQRNRRLRDLIQPLPVRSPVRLGTKTAPYAAEFSVEPENARQRQTGWRRERDSNRRYGSRIAAIFQRLRDVVGPETATERFPHALSGLFPLTGHLLRVVEGPGGTARV
jgi:hypothetical protein